MKESGGVLLGLLLLLCMGGMNARTKPPAPSPVEPKWGPKRDPSIEWRPYIPTPAAVAGRAMQLLHTMNLGEQLIEADPSGQHAQVLYNCTTHPPNAQHKVAHKGVDVWIPKPKSP